MPTNKSAGIKVPEFIKLVQSAPLVATISKLIAMSLVAAISTQLATPQTAFADKFEAIGMNNDGVMHLNARHYEQAITCFQRALDSDSDCTLAQDNLSIAFNNYGLSLAEKDPTRGLSLLCKAVKLTPENPTTCQDLAGMIRQHGKNPRSPQDIAELANRLRARGFSEEAEFLPSLETRYFRLPPIEVKSFALTGDERKLLCWRQGHFDTFIQWNLSTRTVTRSFSPPSTVVCTAIAADEKIIAASEQGGVNIWDTESGTIRCNVSKDGLAGVALSPRGDLLAIAVQSRIKLSNTISGTTIQTLPVTVIRHFSFANSRVLATNTLKSLTLWDATTGKEISTFTDQQHPEAMVKGFAFDSNLRTVVICAFRGDGSEIISLWDIKLRRQLKAIECKPPRGECGTQCLAISPDGKTLACGKGYKLMLLDLTSGKTVNEFPVQPKMIDNWAYNSINSIQFSRDGRTLMDSCSGKIQFWRMDEIRNHAANAPQPTLTLDIPDETPITVLQSK